MNINYSLWVDKYRPKQLNKLELHPHITIQLQKMSESGNIPHLLFYGPSGSGKKTRIITLLKEIYGSGIEKIKVEHRTIKIPNKSTTIELVTVASNYHIEMNPSDSGNQDRIVVQEIIKEIAQSQPLDISNQKPFKVVVLNEVDKLSKDAQHALRRTMEKYMSSCRLILCCNSTSKVIEPVKSRCLAIRIPAPTNDEISQILSSIAKKEGLNVPNEIIKKILEQSNRNLRKAILIFEAAKTKQYPFQVNQIIEKSDWEEYIIQIAQDISEEQSPKRLLIIRKKFYDLLSHCIPPELIIKTLTIELLKKLDSELKYELVQWAAYYEHRLQIGSKPMIHLEAFVAKFMFIYKKFLLSLDTSF